MKENPRITIAELAELIGISTRNIERNIKALQGNGLIARRGPDKGGYWEIIQK